MVKCFVPTEITIIHRNLEASAVIQGLVRGTAGAGWVGVSVRGGRLSGFSCCVSLFLQTAVS